MRGKLAPIGLVAGAIALGPVPAVAQSVETAFQSVVSLLPDWPPSVRRAEEPQGTGVVLMDGRTIVTAAHVIAKALRVRVRTHDGQIITAKSFVTDATTDIAILTIDMTLPAADVTSVNPVLGQDVCAIGNAFGLGLSLTCGVVSGVHRAGVGFNRIEDFVQTDAAVNPGASGGALVTRDGRFVGLLSAIFTKQSDANIGVNFAVSAALVDRVARQLKENGRVSWVNAGLSLVKAPPKGKTGRLAAQVRLVAPDFPAAKAGIKPGDLIVKAGERVIRGPADFRSALALIKPPATIEIVVERAGAERTLTLTL